MNSSPRKYRMSTPIRSGESCGDECDLIELINQLQNKLAAGGHTLKVSLPQIVVVGCQSAGKSSVLESIVGREFLPRGTGVVTRRPTVVQLQPCKEGEDCAIFLHKEGEKFQNFEDVKAEIERETYRLPGPTGFSSQPISLQVYAPDVLKLTLVDLPGLIKNVIGSQSEASIEQVRNMVLEYIEQPNSLILAVSPANQDIANSDALNIAKIVDPERVRTIGVLTKLDLMDEGTNACDVLENKKIFLERGYVGVLNRSQLDIEENRNIAYSLEKEKNYFATHPSYSHMAHRMGTPYLNKMLNQQLRIHIKESLPTVRKELNEKLSTLRAELKSVEEKMGFNFGGTKGVQYYMIKLVQQFIENLCCQILGHSVLVDMKKISPGTVLNYKLYTDLQNCIKLPSIPTKEELMVLIVNMHGIRNTLNVPSQSLEAVCRILLTQYKEPLNECVDEIADMLLACIESSAEQISTYQNLHSEIMNFMTTSIRQAVGETKDALENHLNAEMFFVNIYHKYFKMPKLDDENLASAPVKLWDDREMNGAVSYLDGNAEENFSDISKQSDKIKQNLTANRNAQKNSTVLEKLIQEYMNIERTQIGDIAIKYLVCFLIKKVLDFAKMELVPSLLDLSNLENLLSECEGDFRKRDEIIGTCNALEDALIAVQRF